jgi:hypothetical protein
VTKKLLPNVSGVPDAAALDCAAAVCANPNINTNPTAITASVNPIAASMTRCPQATLHSFNVLVCIADLSHYEFWQARDDAQFATAGVFQKNQRPTW